VLLLEVGTGQFLSALVERSGIDNQVMLHSFCPEEQQEELLHVLTTLGRLWLAGVQIDWAAVHKDEPRLRLSLPTYPFERRHYWIYPEHNYHTGTPGDNKQGATRSLRKGSSSLRARPKLTTDYTAPRNEIEEVLATLWQDMAGIDQVGVYDDFFEIGGHSLLATRLATQIGEAFQVEISPAHVIERHTIADMAELVEMMLIQKVETMPEEEVQRLTNDDFYA
jgi:acyl transferase domain-containing protein